MKKISILMMIVALLMLSKSASWAISTTSSPATTPANTSSTSALDSDRLKKINDLKDKIASKVAELRNQEKGGIYGEVKSVSENMIVITGKKGEQKIVTDEDTSFYKITSGTKADRNLKDIKEKDKIVAFGALDNLSADFVAKYIYLDSPSLSITGTVSAIDRSNGTLTLKGDSQEEIIVDIETFTRTFQVTSETEISKSGFSKVKLGDRLQIRGMANEKESNRMTANRILDLGNFVEITIIPTLSGTTSSPTPPKSPKLSITSEPKQ